MKPRLLWTALIPLWTSRAEACSVCFGDPASAQSKGVAAGVLFLMAVIAGVLAAIAGIALRWRARAKKLSAAALPD